MTGVDEDFLRVVAKSEREWCSSSGSRAGYLAMVILGGQKERNGRDGGRGSVKYHHFSDATLGVGHRPSTHQSNHAKGTKSNEGTYPFRASDKQVPRWGPKTVTEWGAALPYLARSVKYTSYHTSKW